MEIVEIMQSIPPRTTMKRSHIFKEWSMLNFAASSSVIAPWSPALCYVSKMEQIRASTVWKGAVSSNNLWISSVPWNTGIPSVSSLRSEHSACYAPWWLRMWSSLESDGEQTYQFGQRYFQKLMTAILGPFQSEYGWQAHSKWKHQNQCISVWTAFIKQSIFSFQSLFEYNIRSQCVLTRHLGLTLFIAQRTAIAVLRSSELKTRSFCGETQRETYSVTARERESECIPISIEISIKTKCHKINGNGWTDRDPWNHRMQSINIRHIWMSCISIIRWARTNVTKQNRKSSLHRATSTQSQLFCLPIGSNIHSVAKSLCIHSNKSQIPTDAEKRRLETFFWETNAAQLPFNQHPNHFKVIMLRNAMILIITKWTPCTSGNTQLSFEIILGHRRQTVYFQTFKFQWDGCFGIFVGRKDVGDSLDSEEREVDLLWVEVFLLDHWDSQP